MNNVVQIVGEDLEGWEDESSSNRYSIFTQNILLAEKVSKHQHLTPRPSKIEEDDRTSFHSAEPKLSSTAGVDGTTSSTPEGTPAVAQTSTTPANIGRPRTRGRTTRQTGQSSADWTWRPAIPHRVSSMSTRRWKGNGPHRPDLASFHRRSCQLFSSLDSTLSNVTVAQSEHSRTSTGTSPSLASSISTQATSILDDNFYATPTFPAFHVELNPRMSVQTHQRANFGDFFGTVNHTPRLASPRSSSQLDPNVTSTEQVFWTCHQSRESEYAKIDAAHTGFKGFVKRLFPRSWGWVHGKRRKFYEESPATMQKADDANPETDSVRRFRISIASETQEAIEVAESHAASRCVTPMAFNESCLGLDNDVIGRKPSKTRKVFSRVRSSDALSKMFGKGEKNVKKNNRRSTQF